MLGAIAGDIIGSIHEGATSRGRHFMLFPPRCAFTDDSVLSIAVAHALRTGAPYDASLRQWARRYPSAGYGGNFQAWFESDEAGPYQSLGNGSAMRVAPVAWAFDNLDDVLEHARRSAAVTHDHPEGIRGAQAIAAAVFLARTGASKAQISACVTDRFGYRCDFTPEQLQALDGFDMRCEATVPLAIAAFLLSTDFEDAVRIAVSLGGDTDTLACIAGSIAEAHYGMPVRFQAEALRRLDEPLREELKLFAERFRLVHLAGAIPALAARANAGGLPRGVLAEGVSVIARLESIHRWLRGGWRMFTALAPRESLCADMELARAGFASLDEAMEFVHRLELYGLRFMEGGRALDLNVVDAARGVAAPSQWLVLSSASVTPNGPRVVAACLRGNKAGRVAVPEGWSPPGSPSPQAQLPAGEKSGAPGSNVIPFRARP